jgi:hypothetical protein
MTALNADADGARNDHDRALAIYLRDHFAGATAGLALVRRFRRGNPASGPDDVLAGLETEIDDDRRTLEAIMSRLNVTPSSFKSALGAASEVVGRLKSNGRIFHRSPSSSVVELEGLAGGIVTKRNLWRSLRAAAVRRPELDASEFETLIERATSQLDRVLAAHEQAARRAFGSAEPSVAGPQSAA